MDPRDTNVDFETLKRFDRQGPRYTSYPTAVEFQGEIGEQVYRNSLAGLGATDTPVSLYFHLPFCRQRCKFCACHVVITPRQDVATEYLGYLKREIDMVTAELGGRRSVLQMHWGGGTPTYFQPEQLAELFRYVEERFDFQEGAEIAIEVDPRVTTAEHLNTLAELGFNRLSMGVQDFTKEVQEAIGRGQEFEETRVLIEHARKVGFLEGTNIDLVYGLPRQNVAGFEKGLKRVVEVRPERLAIYSFAYVPWIKAHQRKLEQDELPTPEVKLQLYLSALNRLMEAGYEPIGMDHFALPDDELAVAAREGRLERNFMGYTVKPASTIIAFGISAIGDLQTGYFQNEKKLSTYYRAIDAGRLPVERGYLLDDDDRLRRYVIAQLMCNFRVKKAEVKKRFEVDFDEYFADSLNQLGELVEARFVELHPDAIVVTDRGRLFVRNVAMAFDRYLTARGNGKTVFSRTV